MDGPNTQLNFEKLNVLNAEANLKDICRYLRFYKDSDVYQMYLQNYLPMMAKPEYQDSFDEFIGDYADKDAAKALKASLSPPVEVKTVEAVEAPKKRGPKKKIT